MKKIFLPFFVVLCSTQVHAQTERYIADVPVPTMIPFSSVGQRINVDFEIKGNPQVDKATLESINLFQIDQQRQADTRVEIVDANTGLTLIVYSATETTRNKAIVIFGGVE